MQVDFATIRRGRDRLSVFIATLGWSRATYVEFVIDERLETVLGCHERAFYFFGGVPRDVLYDNMRAVVTDRDYYGPGLHRYNRTFLDVILVPAAAVPALSSEDQGQGRALHPLPADELIRAAGEPAQPRRTQGRSRHGQCASWNLAARGRERTRARNHWRDSLGSSRAGAGTSAAD